MDIESLLHELEGFKESTDRKYNRRGDAQSVPIMNPHKKHHYGNPIKDWYTNR